MTPTNNTGITPIKDQVLVRRDQAVTQSAGGIHFPGGSELWESKGTVLAVGPLVQELVPGTRIYFKGGAGRALIPDDREGGREEWERVIVLNSGDATQGAEAPAGRASKKQYGSILGIIEEE